MRRAWVFLLAVGAVPVAASAADPRAGLADRATTAAAVGNAKVVGPEVEMADSIAVANAKVVGPEVGMGEALAVTNAKVVGPEVEMADSIAVANAKVVGPQHVKLEPLTSAKARFVGTIKARGRSEASRVRLVQTHDGRFILDLNSQRSAKN